MPQTNVHRHNRLRFGLFFLVLGLALVAMPASATTFTLQWTGTEADPQRALAVGDLDGDGDLDMVAGNSPPRFYSNNGTGAYTLYNSGNGADNVMDADMGDFNNDGLLDVLISNNVGSPTRIYLNTGGGGLSQAWASPETDYTGRGIVAGDFNNDGFLDCAVGLQTGPKRVYLNNANGTGALSLAWSSPEMEDTLSIDAGDTDGDGDLDFVVGNYALAPRLYRNNGDGTFTSVWTGNPGDSSFRMEMVDLDNDGDLEIVSAGHNMPSRVYRNDGNNAFTDIWNSAENINQAEMDFGDMDADGDMDLVRTGTNANITVFINNGAFSFTPDVVAATPSDDTQGAMLGDVNGDNKLDILVANYFQNSKVYLNTYGGSNTAPPPPTITPEPDGVSGSFKLEWASGGPDDITPNNLMSYNLRVGTAPTLGDVVSAFIPPGPGRPGGGALSWSLYLSDSGSTRTYFWSVQAVDSTGFTKGGFAAEDSFVVGTPPDSNPPPDVVFVFVDGPFQNSTTNLSASWMPGADDPETGTAGYQAELWDSSGPTLVSSSLVLSPSAMVNFANLSLAPGVPYVVKVKAKDGANNLAPGITSPPTGVENSPPTGPTVINDDGANTSNLSSLNVTWDASNDAESGVPGFVLNVGTTPFGSDIVLDFPASGPSSASVPASLTPGQTYFVSVAAVNGAGMTGSYVTTDGILAQTPADVSPPSGPTFVNDDGANTSDLSMLNVVWDSATDVESGVPGFTLNVGTTPGGSDVLLDFPAPGPSSATIPVVLTAGLTYYVSVAAINGAGLTGSYVDTDGILAQTPADSTPPGPVTGLMDEGLYTSSSTQLSISWTAAYDSESGITEYSYSIGTALGLDDVLPLTSVGLALTVIASPLSLSPGLTYYVNVQAANGVGLTSMLTTDGITVDTSGPGAVANLTDEGVNKVNDGSLSASWDAAIDAESGVVAYSVSVMAADGSTLASAQVVTPFYVFSGLPLMDGQTYVIAVQARNGAGSLGPVMMADGILMDPPPAGTDVSPPGPVANLMDEGVQVVNNGGLSASWDAATDPESGVSAYSVSVLAPDGSTLTSLSTANPFVTFTGLTLTDGLIYTIAVQAINGATLLGPPMMTDGVLIMPPGGGGDSTPPSVVANIQPQGPYVNTPDTMVFDWLPATDGESTVTDYSVSLILAGASPSVLAQMNTSIPSATFSALGLTEGQTVYAVVVAINSVGLSGDPAFGPALSIDLTPPVGAGLTYQIVSSGETLAVQLDITPGTDNFSLTLSYTLDRNTAVLSDGVCVDPGPFTALVQLLPDALSFTDFSAAPGACYGYRLLATDSAGNATTADPGLLLALSTTAPPEADITGPTDGFIDYPDGEASASVLIIQFAPGTDPSGLSPNAFIGIASAPYDGVNCGVMAPFSEFAVVATIDQQMAPVTLLPGTCHQFSLTVYDALGNSTTFTSPNIVKFTEGPPPVLPDALTLMSLTADLGVVTPGSFSLEAFVGLTAHETLSNVRLFPTPLVLTPLSSNLTRAASTAETTPPPGAEEPHIPFSMVVADPLVIPALSAEETASLLVKVLAPAGLPTGLYEGLQTVYADRNNNFTPDEDEPVASFLLRVYAPDFAGLELTCPLEELPPLDPNTGGTSP